MSQWWTDEIACRAEGQARRAPGAREPGWWGPRGMDRVILWHRSTSECRKGRTPQPVEARVFSSAALLALVACAQNVPPSQVDGGQSAIDCALPEVAESGVGILPGDSLQISQTLPSVSDGCLTYIARFRLWAKDPSRIGPTDPVTSRWHAVTDAMICNSCDTPVTGTLFGAHEDLANADVMPTAFAQALDPGRSPRVDEAEFVSTPGTPIIAFAIKDAAGRIVPLRAKHPDVLRCGEPLSSAVRGIKTIFLPARSRLFVLHDLPMGSDLPFSDWVNAERADAGISLLPDFQHVDVSLFAKFLGLTPNPSGTGDAAHHEWQNSQDGVLQLSGYPQALTCWDGSARDVSTFGLESETRVSFPEAYWQALSGAQ